MDLRAVGEGAEASRPGVPLITPAFETVWPEVERRLRALLYRRGLDPVSTDDVVQEVALRALANRVTYASAADLMRWAGPVACNLHVDLIRHRARVADQAEAIERPATNDVAGEVVDRLELQRALRGIAALRPADREAIMDAVAAEPVVPRTRKEAVRLAVRRHRARSRLALVLEQLAGWLGGSAWLRRSRRAGAAVAVVPVAAILPLALVFRPPADAPTPAPPRPAVATLDHAHAAVPARAPVVRPARPARPAPSATAVPRPVRAGAPTVREEVAVTPKRPRPTVEVTTPGGYGLRAGKEERPPNAHVVCVRVHQEMDSICVL